MKPILKWQYDQLIKELLLLQEHMADRSCPCETEGEQCVRKHLFTVEGYAEETLGIEEREEWTDKLKMLAAEAKEHREQEERALHRDEVHPVLTDWARDWRKTFEAETLRYYDDEGEGEGKDAGEDET